MIKKKDALVLALLAVVITAVFFSKQISTVPATQDNNTTYLTTKTDTNEIGEVASLENSGWKKYTNKIGNFTINYPEQLFVFEEHEVVEFANFQQGRVIFCAHMIEKTANYCDDGFEILYAIPEGDGWGGGCDEEYQEEIAILGKTQRICKSESGMSQIYLQHPTLPVVTQISTRYKTVFTQDDAEQMLNSFTFIGE